MGNNQLNEPGRQKIEQQNSLHAVLRCVIMPAVSGRVSCVLFQANYACCFRVSVRAVSVCLPFCFGAFMHAVSGCPCVLFQCVHSVSGRLCMLF